MIDLHSLTPDQRRVYDTSMDFVGSGRKLLTVGGVGGSGKSTTTGVLCRELKRIGKRIAVVAPSGKAASVVRDKIGPVLNPEEDYCGTIHSYQYRISYKKEIRMANGEIRDKLYFEMNNKVQRHDLIILEEASMVNRSTFVDLASHGIQIIAVGDHAQLGPIEENNNAPPFNLMLNPDVRLEKILRQAETNPIITIATMVRNGDKIPYGYFGDKVLKTGDVRRTRRHPYGDINSILLCNRNETRIKYINQAREILGYENAGPEVGELIICLRNNMDEGINNGDIGVILETYENSEDTYYVKADMGYGIFSGLTDKEQWYRLYSGGTLEGIERFTWSYASTVHKAQGSEWSRVLVIEERCKGQSDDDWRRWLYTAVSRAKERLEIIG